MPNKIAYVALKHSNLYLAALLIVSKFKIFIFQRKSKIFRQIFVIVSNLIEIFRT